MPHPLFHSNLSRMKTSLVSFAVLSFVSFTPLTAQGREGLSLDVSIGGAQAGGGDRKFASGMQLAAEGTIALRPSASRPAIFALSVGVQGNVANGDDCDVVPGGTGCLPDVPAVKHSALMAGLEHTRKHGSLRALAGPAVFGANGFARKVGGMLQLDATVGFRHFAFLASARGGAVALYPRETFYLGALGLGFRLQQ